MPIELFDIINNKVTATKHCYTIGSLKAIIDKYPKYHTNIFAYFHYMSSLNEEDNPFANVPEADKEDLILKEVGGDFSIDDPIIDKGLKLVNKMYETATYKLYKAAKIGIEKVAKYIETSIITDGRDGNNLSYLRYLERYDEVCRSFDARWKAFQEENTTVSRGQQAIAYDQM